MSRLRRAERNPKPETTPLEDARDPEPAWVAEFTEWTGGEAPTPVPDCAPTATRTRKKLNARRKAEQAARYRDARGAKPDAAPGPKRSRYLGVRWSAERGMWTASVSGAHAYYRIDLGYFEDEAEAARARDRAVIERGIPAPLNLLTREDSLPPCNGLDRVA